MAKIVKGNIEATGQIKGNTLDVGSSAIGNITTNLTVDQEIDTDEHVVATKGYHLRDGTALTGPSETLPILYSRKDLYAQLSGNDFYRNFIAFDTIPASLHSAAGTTTSARSTYKHALIETGCAWSAVATGNNPVTLSDPYIKLRCKGTQIGTSTLIELRSEESTTSKFKKIEVMPDEIKLSSSSANSETLNIALLNLPNDTGSFTSVNLGIRSTGSGSDDRIYKNGTTGFFTGTHIYKAASDIAPGTAVELVNGSVQATSSANSAICVGIVAQTQGATTDNPIETSLGENLTSGWAIKLASVGDVKHRSSIGFLVCNEGGNIAPGDLLVTSSTAGYLMKQSDDIIRSSTVGKAMEAPSFDENGQASGIYGYIYCG
tara:strand:- start:68152 stop:69279 length:1128 start_codon:yes stop_codon:yes gene_type:complete